MVNNSHLIGIDTDTLFISDVVPDLQSTLSNSSYTLIILCIPISHSTVKLTFYNYVQYYNPKKQPTLHDIILIHMQALDGQVLAHHHQQWWSTGVLCIYQLVVH